MKKLLILIAGILLFSSCVEKRPTTLDETTKSRIKLKEYKVINGYGYAIIEVDSVEYLTQGRGGFIKLSK